MELHYNNGQIYKITIQKITINNLAYDSMK